MGSVLKWSNECAYSERGGDGRARLTECAHGAVGVRRAQSHSIMKLRMQKLVGRDELLQVRG